MAKDLKVRKSLRVTTAPALSAGGSSMPSKSAGRTKRPNSNPYSKEQDNRINLQRLNTEQFDALLGLTVDPDTNGVDRSNAAKQAAGLEKKKQENLTTNTGVIASTPNIYEDKDSSSNDNDGKNLDKDKNEIDLNPTEGQNLVGFQVQNSGVHFQEKDPQHISSKSTLNGSKTLQYQNKAKQPSPSKSLEILDNSGPDHLDEVSHPKEKNDQENNQNIDENQSPLSTCKETQTPPMIVICGCEQCKDLITDMLNLLDKHFGSSGKTGGEVVCHQKAVYFLTGNAGNQLPLSNPSDNATEMVRCMNKRPVETPVSPSTTVADEKILLVRGSAVTIPLVAKANLSLDVTDGDPQKLLNALMDIYFKPEEMYNMTCEGQGVESKQLPKDLAHAFKAYIRLKYNKEKYNFNSDLFTRFVNNKCYLARKAMWKKCPELKAQRDLKRKEKRNQLSSTEAEASVQKQLEKKPAAKRKSSKFRSPKKTKVHMSAFRSEDNVQSQHSSGTSDRLINHRPTVGGKRPKSSFADAYNSYMNAKRLASERRSMADGEPLRSPTSDNLEFRDRNSPRQTNHRARGTGSPTSDGRTSGSQSLSPVRAVLKSGPSKHYGHRTPDSEASFKSKGSDCQKRSKDRPMRSPISENPDLGEISSPRQGDHRTRETRSPRTGKDRAAGSKSSLPVKKALFKSGVSTHYQRTPEKEVRYKGEHHARGHKRRRRRESVNDFVCSPLKKRGLSSDDTLHMEPSPKPKRCSTFDRYLYRTSTPKKNRVEISDNAEISITTSNGSNRSSEPETSSNEDSASD